MCVRNEGSLRAALSYCVEVVAFRAGGSELVSVRVFRFDMIDFRSVRSTSVLVAKVAGWMRGCGDIESQAKVVTGWIEEYFRNIMSVRS